MRFTKFLVLLFGLVLSPLASAIVAGGMVAVDRRWPATETGFLDMEFGITVTQEPGRNGFTYWADQFWFKGGNGGYIGLQQRDRDNKALNFSIWDATGWVPEKGANCAFFGHEGEGVQCWIDYPWKQGTTYRIRVVAEDVGLWAAYITDTASGRRRKVATIQVPQAWGGIYATSSFVEDYAQGADERASCADVPPTSAIFHQPRAENGTVVPTSSGARTYGICAAIARASCTTGQDCIGSANVYGNQGDPKVLQHAASGYCLDTPSGSDRAGLWTCTGNGTQLLERDDDFRMLMQAGSKCLQADTGGAVRVVDCLDTSWQRWIPIAGSREVYNVGSGDCLDPANATKGGDVRTAPCSGKRPQRWRMVP